ncbi:MAG: hypothetical protein B7X59_09650 [Polaromonas sp. 39-63-203]|nr:MAG: hypothetical protein B7Y42_05580 [Polaromonas sp. 28-63-22]OYZ83270.1 MAG: hypothetical protein B7Y03_10095 [Polaromonas sp. 24-62-144]OZA96499.1 MAG: hypothetical protein B7X59_09650 [Polaromonas sp. 39-63-203]
MRCFDDGFGDGFGDGFDASLYAHDALPDAGRHLADLRVKVPCQASTGLFPPFFHPSSGLPHAFFMPSSGTRSLYFL